jgi:hypothetical protein
MKRAEAKVGRKLGFAEAARPESRHLELLLAGELQWAMQRLFPQYQAIADLLLPTDLVPDEEPAEETSSLDVERPAQPMLNLGE